MAGLGYAVRETESKSIQHHVELIGQMVDKSLKDPETRQLAVKIVSGSYVWKPTTSCRCTRPGFPGRSPTGPGDSRSAQKR